MGSGHGYHVHADDVEAHGIAGDTAATRVTIDGSSGCERLEQRITRFAPGRSRERRDGERHEVMYVVSGHGTLDVAGEPYPLEPDTGAFIAAGETYSVENPGSDELVVVSVLSPAAQQPDGSRRRVTVRFADQPPLPASPDREFRYLVNEDAGCRDVTQFVGLIPPGWPGLHSHTYDEVVYVIEGEGVLHLNGDRRPLGPGSCIHLPPLREHALENTGSRPMRVLGVFHPSGDPASRACEDMVR